jgi:hypothetical protein
MEIALNLISPMPFLYDVKYTDYYHVEGVDVRIHLNTALLVIMVLCRIYHVESCVLISTYYMSDCAYRVSLIYGRALGYGFALKSIYKTHPFMLWYAHYAFFLVIYGYLMRSVEYEANDGNLSDKIFTARNSIWWSMMTMTTVGYGDFFPKTILGRSVGVIAAFNGGLLEALAILSCQRGLKMDWPQLNSYKMIVSLNKKEKVKKLAVSMLTAVYRMGKAPGDKYAKYAKKHSVNSHLFAKKSRELRSANRLSKNMINQFVASQCNKEIRQWKRYVQALALYHKTKIIPRRQRNIISRRFDIPGYSDQEKTTAGHLKQIERTPTKTQLDHPSIEDMSSSSILDSCSVSNFMYGSNSS